MHYLLCIATHDDWSQSNGLLQSATHSSRSLLQAKSKSALCFTFVRVSATFHSLVLIAYRQLQSLIVACALKIHNWTPAFAPNNDAIWLLSIYFQLIKLHCLFGLKNGKKTDINQIFSIRSLGAHNNLFPQNTNEYINCWFCSFFLFLPRLHSTDLEYLSLLVVDSWLYLSLSVIMLSSRKWLRRVDWRNIFALRTKC